MDQRKIGRFIAERRKRNNLTQIQLAEKLHVTDRAVSKWENGRSMPDSSIMLELCDILKISVNDLLNGEVVIVSDYNKELENRLIEMVKQKEESDKRLLTLELVIGILSCIILLVPCFIAAYVPMKDWIRAVVAFSGFIPGIIGLCFAMKIEQVVGYYECKECGHKYVPALKSMYLAQHIGITRYMRCPKCNKKSWNKKVLTKE